MSPQAQLVLAVMFFTLLWIATGQKRQWIHLTSKRRARRATLFAQLLLGVPRFMWFVIAIAAAFALTNPKSTVVSSFIEVERKVFVVSIDASTSMGQGPESTMERIKANVIEFVKTREGDVIGISAYSGYPGRKNGARMLIQPTEDIEQVVASVDAVESRMFGSHTAIGDGVIVSVISLIADDAIRAMGDAFNKDLLKASIETYGTTSENIAYAQEVADAIGPQDGKFLILFTDGKYNTGMDPGKALWFARRIGMHAHFIAFESSSATGLSASQQVERKKELMIAVLKTGGLFLESRDIQAMPRLFEEVSLAESNLVVLATAIHEVDLRYAVYQFMALCMLVWFVSEHVWMKVP